MPLLDYQDKHPEVHESAFIAPDAWIIGDVKLAEGVSVFFGAVLRGDLEPLIVGRGSNIQEHSVFHTTKGGLPVELDENVTIGHGAILHSCKVCRSAVVGMGAVVMDGAIIGEKALVAAGTIVTPGTEVPPGQLIAGNPGKIKRELKSEEYDHFETVAKRYREVGASYKEIFRKG